MPISYSLCWEDPQIMLDALKIRKSDTVLSIASGGENSLAILLKNPAKVVAIDNNKSQTSLVNLKIAAIKALDFYECAKFLGFQPATNRLSSFSKCKDYLNPDDLEYWNQRTNLIQQGIVHSGKFERYISYFRKLTLTLALSKLNAERFVSLGTIREQQDFYRQKWNNWRWRLLVTTYWSRYILQLLGRKKEFFKFCKIKNIGGHYLERFEYVLNKVSIRNNFFYNFILNSTLPIPFESHPYLDETNFYILKKRLHKIEIVTCDLFQYLKKTKNGEFSKFNLSNVFELMPQTSYELILQEIAKKSKTGSRIVYWNNLVPRFRHPSCLEFVPDSKLSRNLYNKDRFGLYSRFIVEINKKLSKKLTI